MHVYMPRINSGMNIVLILIVMPRLRSNEHYLPSAFNKQHFHMMGSHISTQWLFWIFTKVNLPFCLCACHWTFFLFIGLLKMTGVPVLCYRKTILMPVIFTSLVVIEGNYHGAMRLKKRNRILTVARVSRERFLELYDCCIITNYFGRER